MTFVSPANVRWPEHHSVRVCLSMNLCLTFLFNVSFGFFFTFFSPPIYAHGIAPWVININIDIVDKRIVFPSNFHLPFSRRDSEQPTCRLIPHLSAESCLFR